MTQRYNEMETVRQQYSEKETQTVRQQHTVRQLKKQTLIQGHIETTTQ